MKTSKLIVGALFAAGIGFASVSAAGAGQPGATCGDPGAMTRPGNAASAPGSAFNEDGKAGTVYAGEQPQNSTNPKPVSQYDVACLQVSTP